MDVRTIAGFTEALLAQFLLEGWGQVAPEVAALIPPEIALLAGPQGGLLLVPGQFVVGNEVEARLDRWRERLSQPPLNQLSRLDIVYLFEQPPAPEQVKAMEAMRSFAMSDRVVKVAWVDLATPTVRLDTAKRSSVGAGSFFTAVPSAPTTTAKTLIARILATEAPVPTLLDAVRHVTEEDSKVRGFIEAMQRVTPWGTWLIAAVCALMFAWETAAGGSQQNDVLLRLGALFPPLVRKGEWWRIFGSTFLHIGIAHIALNMYALFMVGPTCEKIFGNVRFLALYAVAGAAGSWAGVEFTDAIGAGASGAIFGIFGATAVVGWKLRDEVPPRLVSRLTTGMVPVIVINILFGLSVRQVGNVMIGNAAHIGGLIGGALFALLVPPAVSTRQPRFVAVLTPLFVVLAALPFVTEAYVAYRAVAPVNVMASPTQEYRGADFAFRYPTAMEQAHSDDGAAFEARGLVVDVAVLPPSDRSKPDAVRDQAASELASIEAKYDDRAGGRAWSCVRGRLRDGEGVIGAFTSQGNRVFRIQVNYDKSMADQAAALARLIEESFTVLR